MWVRARDGCDGAAGRTRSAAQSEDVEFENHCESFGLMCKDLDEVRLRCFAAAFSERGRSAIGDGAC